MRRRAAAFRWVARGLLCSLAALGTVASTRPAPDGALRAGVPSPAAPAADTLANGIPRALVPALRDWVRVWRHAIPGFSADSLARGATAPFRFESAWPGAGGVEDDVRTRARVDVVSPDSSYSLDFDMFLTIEGDLIGGDVDAAPILADFRRDTIWRVAFCGTSCNFDGAYWVDASRFALTGVKRSGPQEDGPASGFLEVYDLNSRRRTSWTAPATDDPGFTRYSAANESALQARVLQARRGAASQEARSRVDRGREMEWRRPATPGHGRDSRPTAE